MATKTLKATCLCGRAAHELAIPASSLPLKLTFCHCTSCRHMTGTLNLTTAVLPASYEPLPDLLTNLTLYEFFERIDAYFCSSCGTHMLFYVKHTSGNASSSGYWAVHTGTLEQADDILEADVHWFVADTLDGGFADLLPQFRNTDIPRYSGFKGRTEQLPLYWKSPERPGITTSLSDRLHCYCRCAKVEFWIARPSEQSEEALGRSKHGKHYEAEVCGCNSCRLDTGMEWTEWAVTPTMNISLDAIGRVPFSASLGSLKAFSSSLKVLRYHCDSCGASVFYRTDERPDLTYVAIGLIDAPEGARAEGWLDWYSRLAFRDDALLRAKDLTSAVEFGLEEYARRKVEVSKVVR